MDNLATISPITLHKKALAQSVSHLVYNFRNLCFPFTVRNTNIHYGEGIDAQTERKRERERDEPQIDYGDL